MQTPGGYLGIEELGVNLQMGLPEELALFSEFKHCICKRRRNLLKKDIFFKCGISLSHHKFLLTSLISPSPGITNLLTIPSSTPRNSFSPDS